MIDDLDYCYVSLKIAIVKRAILDLKLAKKKKQEKKIERIESFFYSSEFKDVFDVDPDFILENI